MRDVPVEKHAACPNRAVYNAPDLVTFQHNFLPTYIYLIAHAALWPGTAMMTY